MMYFLIWIAVILSVLALYFRQVYSRFSKYGVKHFKPIPPVGNAAWVLLRRMHFIDGLIKVYKSFPEDRFVGNFDFLRPTLMVRDVDLIKNIVIKDFEYFLDHTTFVDETVDPLFGRNLFSLKGQEWKEMRSTLSPAFTSSKIRLMVPFMVEIGKQMIKSLKNSIQDSADKFVDIDCKELLTRYANDVIASCAFGLKVDSHNEEDNEFYKMGKLATNMSLKQFLLLLAFNSFPRIVKKFKLSVFPQAMKDFFKNLVTNMMNDREENNIIRPDMIHLLMEAKKGKLSADDKDTKDDTAGYATVKEMTILKKDAKKVWSDDDLIAQAMLFFFAGFETVSTAMAFALQELAANPEIQERLVQEIKDNDAKHGGKYDYNTVQNMTYLDMVVTETLRKWPAVAGLDRTCTKDYNMGKPNKQAPCDYIIRKGEVISIPSWAIHRDPEFYPNPDKFDPERFSETNKHLIKPFTYMPFGLGPRNCIGSRFALCEFKVMLHQLLQNLEVSLCEKSCISEKLDKTTISVRLEGGHWLRFRIRK